MLNLLELSIAPVAFLLIYIYKRDVISQEPKKELAKAFVGGVLSTILVIAPLMFLAIDAESWKDPFLSAFGQGFLEAGIPEELMKFFILYILIWKNKYFDEYFDGIVYAVFVSMGFACIENILYVFENGAGVGIVRAFTAVPGHFFFAVIMGYYFSMAKFDKFNRKKHMLKAITLPMLVHGTYDMILLYSDALIEIDIDEYIWLVLLLIIFFFVFNFKLWKHGIKKIRELRAVDQSRLEEMNKESVE